LRIAVANDGGYVSGHFGRCAEYVLFDVEDGKVVSQTAIPTPSHQPGVLPPYLAQHGANCVIAGGMGQRAQELFASEGVEVVMGVQGKVEDVLQAYLAGQTTGGPSTCSRPDGHGS
jgi:predicted Fe-Mo cluster-binding NifX family protein